MKVQSRPTSEIVPYARNPRTISDAAVAKLAGSIKEFGFQQPLVVDEDTVIIVGHTRLLAAQKLGLAKVPVVVVEGWSEAKKRAYRIADNRVGQETSWELDELGLELSELDGEFLDVLGFDEDELDAMFGEDAAEGRARCAGNLSEQFGVPPFSVLNARAGWWQDRKRQWLALGIQSEIGRGAGSAPGGAKMPVPYIGADGKFERRDLGMGVEPRQV
jgi:hypothetical protein